MLSLETHMADPEERTRRPDYKYRHFFDQKLNEQDPYGVTKREQQDLDNVRDYLWDKNLTEF